MLAVFLLCAAFALNGATEKREEKAVAQEVAGGSKPNLRVKRAVCPPGWSSNGFRCFIFVNSPLTWIDAEKHCWQYGANLASIHSSNEYSFVQNTVRGRIGELTQAWIGATEGDLNGQWLWTDGSSFDYQAWNSGEPNQRGFEQCVEMNGGDGRGWNDFTCGSMLPFVCGITLT